MTNCGEECIKNLEDQLDSFRYGMAALGVILTLLTAVLLLSLYTVTSREAKAYKRLLYLEKKKDEDSKLPPA